MPKRTTAGLSQKALSRSSRSSVCNACSYASKTSFTSATTEGMPISIGPCASGLLIGHLPQGLEVERPLYGRRVVEPSQPRPAHDDVLYVGDVDETALFHEDV